MKRTTRASVQPKPTPGPPTLQPHTDGRWQVVDYRGYVVFCGHEHIARLIWQTHNELAKRDAGQSLLDAIGRG